MSSAVPDQICMKAKKNVTRKKIDILLPGCVKLSTDLPVNRSTRCSFYCSLQLCIDHHSHSIKATKRWGAALCWWTPLARDYVKNLRFARICWWTLGKFGRFTSRSSKREHGLRTVCPISKIVPNTKLHPKAENQTVPGHAFGYTGKFMDNVEKSGTEG